MIAENSMKNAGIIGQNNMAVEENLYIYSKILTGMDPRSGGGYTSSVPSLTFEASAEEKKDFVLAKLHEYWPTTEGLWDFFDAKIRRVWMAKDDFVWWTFGLTTEAQAETDQGICSPMRDLALDRLSLLSRAFVLLDFLYVGLMNLCALFGTILRRRQETTLDLAVWALLGWIGVHFIIEVMQRYRYFGMALVAVFAAIGLCELIDCTNKIHDRIKTKTLKKPKASTAFQSNTGL